MPADPTREPGRPGSRNRDAKPKTKPKPKPNIAASVRQIGRQGVRTARTMPTSGAPSPTPRSLFGSSGSGGRTPASVDRARAQFEAEVADYSAKRKAGTVKAPAGAKLSPAGLDRLQLLHGGSRSFLGGLIANFGGDALSTVTGIPSLAQLGAENLAAFNPGTMGARVLSEAGVPGLGGVAGYQRRVAGMDVQAAKSTAADYKHRYGDLAKVNLLDAALGRGSSRANLRRFGGKAYEHPGLTAMDVAFAYSAAGAATRLGAKAAGALTGSERLARAGSLDITPAGTRVPGSTRVSTGARYRPPKVRTVEMGENTAEGLKGRSVARIEIPQRPRPKNTISRGIQSGIVEPVGKRVAGALERRAEAGNRLAQPFGVQAKFNRAVAKSARDYRLSADMGRSKALRVESADYVKSVRELERSGLSDLARGGKAKYSREQINAALFLHGRDLLDVPGLTKTQARDVVVAHMRSGSDTAVKTYGAKNAGAQATIDSIAKVPDELLDLKKAPPAFQHAVEQYRALSAKATEGRIAAGTITPETAAAVTSRSAQAVHEGILYDPKSGQWTSPRNPYSPVGSKGVYTQDVPVDRLKTGSAGNPATAGGRMTQDKTYQSHGTLFKQGNVSIERGLPIKALERALVDRTHPQFVKDFYETFAFRRPNGQLSKGPRAITAMEADPEHVVLLSEKSLNDAMRLAQDLPEGEMPESPLAGVVSYEGKDGLALARKHNSKDLVAFPKAAVEGMREGWTYTPGQGMKGFKLLDTPTQLWKRGILAFAPRYYINNLTGNTLQYGMLTAFDLRALRLAFDKRIGEIVPERIRGSTNVAEARITDPRTAPKTKSMRNFMRSSDALMGKQGAFDSLFRKAAYISRMRKLLKNEGVKSRGMSPEAFSEAVRTAPKELVDQAMRETELFMGDYLRLGPTERAVLRRVFPFYSWMRVIGRFMLEVPIRHPKRVALTSLMARASSEVINPTDYQQPILANRGRINVGPFSMRTAGPNPLFTHSDVLKSVLGGDVKGTLGAVSSNTSPVFLQGLLRNYSGTGPFGAPITYPPGYGESYGSFGGPLKRTDPVTGLPDYYTPSVPLTEQALQLVPLVPQILRGIASRGRQPYDVTTTSDLLIGGKSASEMFKPKKDRAMEPIPGIGPFLGWAGMNFQRRDRAKEAADFRKLLEDAREAQRQTAKRKRKAR